MSGSDARLLELLTKAIAVSNEELYTVRDAMRELNRLVTRIEAGELEKVVLTTGGKLRAVVITVDEYSVLSDRILPAGPAASAVGERNARQRPIHKPGRERRVVAVPAPSRSEHGQERAPGTTFDGVLAGGGSA